MQHQDATVARPTAAWISRYAADLLASTPGMHPLDAVRLAMEAAPELRTGGASAGRGAASGIQTQAGADEGPGPS